MWFVMWNERKSQKPAFICGKFLRYLCARSRLTKLLKAAHFLAYRKTRCFPEAGKDGSECDEENLGGSGRRGKSGEPFFRGKILAGWVREDTQLPNFRRSLSKRICSLKAQSESKMIFYLLLRIIFEDFLYRFKFCKFQSFELIVFFYYYGFQTMNQ